MLKEHYYYSNLKTEYKNMSVVEKYVYFRRMSFKYNKILNKNYFFKRIKYEDK